MPKAHAKHDIATRAQALTLITEGVSVPRITKITGISRTAIYDILKRAKERGYNPSKDSDEPYPILEKYVQDGERSGRPSKRTEANESLIRERLLPDADGHMKSYRDIAKELNVQGGMSSTTVWRIVKDGAMKEKGKTKGREKDREGEEEMLIHENMDVEEGAASAGPMGPASPLGQHEMQNQHAENADTNEMPDYLDPALRQSGPHGAWRDQLQSTTAS